MEVMESNSFFYKRLLEVAEVVKQYSLRLESDPTLGPLKISVFCRRGEKRSVGFATYLWHCLHHGMQWQGTVEHLCAHLWYRTCAGSCAACANWAQPNNSAWARRVVAHWMNLLASTPQVYQI